MHLLACADGGGRVIIAHRACRMLFEGRVHGYLNPIQYSRCGACPLGLREYETAHVETLNAKTTSATLSGDKERKWKVSYTSEDPEAKFTRERCIRVAAIVIMIRLGISNICGVKRIKKPGVFLHR